MVHRIYQICFVRVLSDVFSSALSKLGFYAAHSGRGILAQSVSFEDCSNEDIIHYYNTLYFYPKHMEDETLFCHLLEAM